MKIAIACCFLLCAAYVTCEPCTTNMDCTSTNTSCNQGWVPICEHPDPNQGIQPGNGLCTCAAPQGCTTKEDCAGQIACPPNRYHHCYDQRCICSRFQ